MRKEGGGGGKDNLAKGYLFLCHKLMRGCDSIHWFNSRIKNIKYFRGRAAHVLKVEVIFHS